MHALLRNNCIIDNIYMLESTSLRGEAKRMMIEMTKEELERKLKRERVEVCLNCVKFLKCESIGKFEICDDFEELEHESWIVKQV